MFKLIAFDIDNTLAKLDEPMLPETVEALKVIESKGVQLLFISGRPVSYVTGFVRQIGLVRPYVSGSNGGVIKRSITVPPKGVYTFPLSDYQTQQMARLRHELQEKWGQRIWFQPNLLQVSIFHYGDDVRSAIATYMDEKFLEPAFKEAFKVYQHFDCIDILPIQVSKGNGLNYVMNQLGVLRQETLAVGDSINDYSMFRVAGYAIGIQLKEELTDVIPMATIGDAMTWILNQLD